MSSDSPRTMPSLTHEIEFRVRYAETDQMGVVYHANYLVWCEIGRTDLIRQLGLPYAQLEHDGVILAVADASLRYHASAVYDDLIRVETHIRQVRSRTIHFEYFVFHAERGDKLATAQTTLVSLDRDGRPTALPADLRGILEQAVTS